MNFAEFKRELLEHYVSMTFIPGGWDRQAWSSVKKLAQEHPSQFGDMPRMLEEEVFKRRGRTTQNHG